MSDTLVSLALELAGDPSVGHKPSYLIEVIQHHADSTRYHPADLGSLSWWEHKPNSPMAIRICALITQLQANPVQNWDRVHELAINLRRICDEDPRAIRTEGMIVNQIMTAVATLVDAVRPMDPAKEQGIKLWDRVEGIHRSKSNLPTQLKGLRGEVIDISTSGVPSALVQFPDPIRIGGEASDQYWLEVQDLKVVL